MTMSLSNKLVGIAMLLAFAMPMFAVLPVQAQDTSYVPITASDLLEVDESGTTFGQVAGLGTQDLRTTIARIIRAILTFLGVVAVVIILWGGFKWMTSGGADEKTKEARKFIVMGVVGLAIVLSAYAIASFVISSLVTATTAPSVSAF